MRTLLLSVLTIVFLSTAMSHGAVLVHEGFADNTTNNRTIVGYSGPSSTGLAGPWSLNAAGDQDQEQLKFANQFWRGIDGGYAPDQNGSGNRTFWERVNAWSTNIAECPLSRPIDMSQDGTWYMSFFSKTRFDDCVTQVGLNDGTNELMWGQGFEGDATKGITAYTGPIGTDVKTNADGTNPSDTDNNVDTYFWVARLTRSDPNLIVDFSVYVLTDGETVDATEPLTWSRSVELSGVNSVFTHLELKVNGNGSNWPAIDEVRVGQSYADVTFGNIQLVGPADGATLVPTDSDLEWTVGNGRSVDVYFAGPFSEPNDAPVLNLVDTNNSAEIYDPGALANDGWYYWRVDELEPNTVGFIAHPGPTWSFQTIPATPVINDQPDSQTVAAGDDAAFTVAGLNISNYQWYHSVDPVIDINADTPLGTNSSQTVSNVQLTDEGWYYCAVDNGGPVFLTDAAQLMTRRLVGWWKLDGDLTDSVQDVVAAASANDGTVVESQTDPNNLLPFGFDTGVAGSALSLASGGDYVVVDTANEMFNFYSQGFTLSAWVKTTDTTWSPYVSKQTDVDPDETGIYIAQNSGGGSNDAVVAVRPHGGLDFADDNLEADGLTLSDDQWHLVTGTLDASGIARIYVDGVLQDTSSAPTQAISAVGNTAPLFIGAWGSPATQSGYTGLIDDVRYYSYPLDDFAVAQLYVDAIPNSSICVINPEFDITGPEGTPDCITNLLDLMPIFGDWLTDNTVTSP